MRVPLRLPEHRSRDNSVRHGVSLIFWTNSLERPLCRSVLDFNNAEFGLFNGLHLGPFGPGAFAGSISQIVGPYTAGTSFSLTEVVRITHGGGVNLTSFDAESDVIVPAAYGRNIAAGCIQVPAGDHTSIAAGNTAQPCHKCVRPRIGGAGTECSLAAHCNIADYC